MKSKLIAILAICLFAFQAMNAQIPRPKEYQWKVKYLETVTTKYILDKDVSLTEGDKSILKNTLSEKVVEKYFTDSSLVPIVYYETIRTENLYEDWMTSAQTIRMDENQIISYDSRGDVIFTIPIPESDLLGQQIGQLPQNVFMEFRTPNAAEVSAWSNYGKDFQFNIDAAGNLAISSEYGDIFYDYQKKMETATRLDEGGKLIATNTSYYRPVTSIYPAHRGMFDVLPTFQKEVFEEKLPSGNCVQFVKTTRYEAYEIDESISTPRSKLKADGVAWYYPNPTTDHLNIRNDSKEEISIAIYDVNGRILLEDKAIGPKVLDVSALENNLYILQVKSKSEDHFYKFIKL